MTTELNDLISFDGGYFPTQGLINGERVPNTMIEGSKNVWFEGPNRIRSWGGVSSYASYGNSVMGLLGSNIYTMASGSACLYRNGAIFFIGSGAIQYGSTTATNIGNASTTLRLTLDGSSGSSFAAGISAPTNAPTATQSATASNQPLVGTYSFKYTVIRDSDNAESNGSPASDVFTSDGKHKVTLTLQSGPIIAGASTSLGIYISRRGFPEGPWYYLRKVPSSTSSIDLAWLDGDLLRFTSPLDNDPPLAGTHVIALGDRIVLLGVLGGGGVSCSKPNNGEHFPPDIITYLNPNEPIIGIRGRPSDGWQYVFCRNSLHAVLLTGDDNAPIETRAIWSETGIANANAASFVGGEFYGYSGRRGALRTTAGNQSAEPDVSFAMPIESDMASWDSSKVVVGWSPDDDAVVYFHDNTAWVYKRKTGKWCAPFILADGGAASGTVTSCVTYMGKLIFSIGSAMYEFSGGTSNSIPWKIMPQWRDGGAPGYYKTITRWRTACDVGTSALNTDLLINFLSASAESQAFTGTASGGVTAAYPDWKKTNIKNVIAYTLQYTGTGANQYVYGSTVLGGISRITV